MARKASINDDMLRDLFWLMVAGQVVLVGVFTWVLLSGVRSGLASVNRLSDELEQRSSNDDLQPREVQGLAAEIRPLVVHFNSLLAQLDDSMHGPHRFIGHASN